MQVMVVDDEPNILSGIERTLTFGDPDWHCRFAASGQDALAMLEAQPADVVISDMRMPFMDGAQLLQEVRERWPSTIRIILTGYSEMDATLRMIDVAHQFVTKPCNSNELLAAMDNILRLRRLFSDQDAAARIGRVARLPAAPTVFLEVSRLIEDPESPLGAISELLASDPALTAKILQLANSAYFAGGQEVRSVEQAVTRLGLDHIRLLVLASQVFETGEGSNIDLDALQHRALAASHIAAHIGSAKGPAPVAALLAHIALGLPEAGIPADAPPAMISAVGAYLLALWGLPIDIVSAVAWHHDPEQMATGAFDTVGIVHVAVLLANGGTPDIDYLERVGMADRLPQWQADMATQIGHDDDQ